ncbi:hypothetical protein FKM82_012339 [Ascaphus truei]
MKATGVIVLVAAALISFSGVKSYSSNAGYEIDCSRYKKNADEDMVCTREYRSLCGTDGVTYANECQMCAARLSKKTNIYAKHKGSCDTQGEKLDCSSYTGNMCTMEFQAHCGTDGVTYGNRCNYCHAQRKKSTLSLLFVEHCYYNNNYVT